MTKITNAQVLSLQAALASLDGIDGKAYKLKAKAIYAIGRNITLINPAQQALEKARLELNNQGLKAVEINTQWIDLLQQDSGVELYNCQWDWLDTYDEETNKNGNVIPVSVIGGLLPILKGMPEPSKD